jgi:hypothetical protein
MEGQRYKPIVLVVGDERMITDTLVIVLEPAGGAFDVPASRMM